MTCYLHHALQVIGLPQRLEIVETYGPFDQIPKGMIEDLESYGSDWAVVVDYQSDLVDKKDLHRELQYRPIDRAGNTRLSE